MSTPSESDSAKPDSLPLPGAGIDFRDPNSPLAPFYLRSSQVLAIAILSAAFLIMNFGRLFYSDTWSHLKFGEWIVQHQEIPPHEPFSDFSDQSEPYIAFQWLTQVCSHYAYTIGSNLLGGDELRRLAGGVDMLRTWHALLTVLRLGALLIAFRRVGNSLTLACLGILVVFASYQGSVQRPQVVGELCFACLLMLLSRTERSWLFLLWMPLLMVVWANAHGSFLIGFFLAGLFLAGQVIESIWNRRSAIPLFFDTGAIKLLSAIFISVVAVAFLNPHGPLLYLEVLQLPQDPNVPTLVEWQPLDFNDAEGWGSTYLALLMMLTISQLLSPRAMSPTQLILVLAFAPLPLWSRRLFVWWIMIVPWLAIPHWNAALEQLFLWREREDPPDLRKSLLAFGIILLAIAWSNPVGWIIAGKPTPLHQSLWSTTPWRLAIEIDGRGKVKELAPLREVLKENYPDGKLTGSVFTSETLGDYLVWNLSDARALFVYSHAHLFPKSHWDEHLTLLSGSNNWREILDRHRINLVVIESALRKELAEKIRQDPGWKVVLDDKSGSTLPGGLFVAVRKIPVLDVAPRK